ncbi:DUF438 domain-containing protein [Neobacillus sp. NPDC097160]|uniref:DUF438 domain-containing protein n=1 Tax=Neobacillus sp. NPDC097160 TaxID=3364298 RepID=UPI003830827F
MSEFINNREQLTTKNTDRITILKQIFQDPHNGRNLDVVKAHFDAFIGKITVDEISQLQHDFGEGISTAELQRLYSQHSALFNGSIEKESYKTIRPEDQPGHPIHTFKLENQEIEKLLKTKIQIHLWQKVFLDSL